MLLGILTLESKVMSITNNKDYRKQNNCHNIITFTQLCIITLSNYTKPEKHFVTLTTEGQIVITVGRTNKYLMVLAILVYNRPVYSINIKTALDIAASAAVFCKQI